MDTIKPILIGVLLPGIISLVVFWLAWASARVVDDRRWRSWAGALAFGAAFCLGFLFLLGWPAYPPADAVRWLPWFALGGVIIGLIDGAVRPPYLYLWLIRMAAVGAVVSLLLEPNIRGKWSSDLSFHWVLWLSVAIIIFWSAIDEAAWRVKGWSLPLALALATLALSLSLLWCGSALYFQVGIMLAVTSGAAFLVALGRHQLSLASGAVPVFIAVYYGLLICGYFFAELPQLDFLEFRLEQLCAPLLAIAPACAVWGLSGKMHRNPQKQATATFLWVLIPAVVAAVLAYIAAAGSVAYF